MKSIDDSAIFYSGKYPKDLVVKIIAMTKDNIPLRTIAGKTGVPETTIVMAILE